MAKMSNTDIRKMVQGKILEALDKGVNPWRKPWTVDGSLMPHNCISGHQYRGVNVPYLWAVQMLNEYPTAQWLTFNQARKAGGHVRKGEKAAAYVIFTKPIVVKDENEDGSEEKKTIHMLRCTPVFNIAQTEGVKLPARETVEVEKLEPSELVASVQDFMGSVGAVVKYNGHSAHYAPRKDEIGLPQVEQFESSEAFAATALHELVHWTGHKSRCNRPGIVEFGGFGSASYAMEELVAELGAAMLCERFQVANEIDNHASYIENWRKVIEADERAIFRAARMAEQAMDWLDEAEGVKAAA
jgi:antirestriction protein ArdC